MSNFTNHRNQLKAYESQAQQIINIYSAVGAFEDYSPGRRFTFNGFSNESPKQPWEPKEGYIYVQCSTPVADYSESTFIEAPLDFFDKFDEEYIRQVAQAIVNDRAQAAALAKEKAEAQKRVQQEKDDLEKLQELAFRYPTEAQRILKSE